MTVEERKRVARLEAFGKYNAKATTCGVRFRQEDLTRIDEAAAAAGLSRATWIRQVVQQRLGPLP